jgi:hypothetical protein
VIKCGIDLNSWSNGVFLPPKKHYRTFRKEYRAAINNIMEKYDSRKPLGTCFPSPNNGYKSIYQALDDIAELLRQGKFLNNP